MNKREQNEIIEQYQDGTIHVLEMVERLFATIDRADVRDYFLEAPVRFASKLGLPEEPGTSEETRVEEMRKFCARIYAHGAALLAESFEGHVPSIYSTSDGKIVVVEQNLDCEEHRTDPRYVPTTTHVIDISK